jgi:hypothetical protein
MFFDFNDIKGIGSWAVLLTLLLVVAGFFALPVLLFVGAAYGLALLFGRNH